jgi:hypothetical protein
LNIRTSEYRKNFIRGGSSAIRFLFTYFYEYTQNKPLEVQSEETLGVGWLGEPSLHCYSQSMDLSMRAGAFFSLRFTET